ncbi:amphi-Trp domain-containing protein [Desulfovibrio oxamicus]|uniref:Amphi-Trp domain-containing protein n=1 Tax=Nitratidesulfovibrio oxamicus TaxID=32016 RepID=A0ABS0J228_9BACT|nr:amphi-Trp domain-containing protein [Nitratidesulfovibrio oxamicus]MBG3876482.1 amphi-Trp domain-containing protein [Nitratidesulfovibrio oxamicus]
MEKQKISLSTRLLCADAAGVVEALAEGLKERCLKVQKGDETLVLSPPEAVDVDVEAKVRDGRGKFMIEISWRIPDDETVAACEEVANLPGRDHLAPLGCADVEEVGDIDLDVALKKADKPAKAKARDHKDEKRDGDKERDGDKKKDKPGKDARPEKKSKPEKGDKSAKDGKDKPGKSDKKDGKSKDAE